MWGFKSVPVEVPVTGPTDGDVVPLGDEVPEADPIDVNIDPIDTEKGPTVEAMQWLGEENDAVESLSQPLGFRRDVGMDHGNSKIKCNSAGSHGSSRLLKKPVLADIEDISKIMKQYVEMGKLLGYDMEGNKDKHPFLSQEELGEVFVCSKWSAEKRSGSAFCSSFAGDFNDFIDDVEGVDVPMIGNKFTRVDISSVKLSKLDRFLAFEGNFDRFQGLQVAVLDRMWSDHYPILLHEGNVDYGPPPFRFFNLWLLLDGFDEMIRASVSEFVEEFKSRLHDIDICIDSGDISIPLSNERKQVLGSLAAIENQEMSEVVQKAKVKWYIEGDENSVFFHGPDGFSFQFLKHYWDILGGDVIAFVQEFFYKPIIPVGCNSSFITLIPKVDNPLLVNDFRHISLIGMQFKIIAKILAKRLVVVLPNVISVDRLAFLKGRQILDGPLMSEVISLASITGCAAANFPFSYLGISVDGSMSRVSSWDVIVDRFCKRLSKWKVKMLSIGGRLTLVKSVLGNLGIYFFSLFHMLVTVCHLLESLRARFFWGMEEDQRRIHWVKWDIILNSRDKGGL
uniref:Reverse transcriptase domain-containing protein n=1 Tax=Lactuca sativa TaxID=4236 RepID=A0A9R1W6R3_LACSA|nr:hypothetical protein LSAT_V11C300119750 [Lactuca sativa]